MQLLRGTGAALVTPFTLKGGVDLEALDRLVQQLVKDGIDYLVVLGTTAESVTLSSEEKQKVIAQVITSNNNRLPLVLGLGGNNTALAISQLKNTDLSPFTAILSVSPAYNKPTQEGIYQHYKAIAQQSAIPVVLYNVPSRTGSNIQPKTVFRLTKDFKNIIGLKEAKADMVQALRLLKDRPKDFLIISGDDMLALPIIAAGGDGVISVVSQGLPKLFSTMVNHALDGQLTKASQLHFKAIEIIDLIFEEGNPAGIKALLDQLGICQSTVRLPLVPASKALKQKIALSLDSL